MFILYSICIAVDSFGFARTKRGIHCLSTYTHTHVFHNANIIPLRVSQMKSFLNVYIESVEGEEEGANGGWRRGYSIYIVLAVPVLSHQNGLLRTEAGICCFFSHPFSFVAFMQCWLCRCRYTAIGFAFCLLCRPEPDRTITKTIHLTVPAQSPASHFNPSHSSSLGTQSDIHQSLCENPPDSLPLLT